jgi:hypothetical protein
MRDATDPESPEIRRLARRVADHEETVMEQISRLDFRIGSVEKRVARGAFLGVLLAEALRVGAPGIGQVIVQILGGA